MSARALLAELNRLGVELRADGDRLRYAGPEETITEELLEKLKAHKAELLALLRRNRAATPKSQRLAATLDTQSSVWPQECLDAERRFGHRAARLYPLLNRRVQTSRGPGKLWQVMAGRAGVVLDEEPKKVLFVSLGEIKLC